MKDTSIALLRPLVDRVHTITVDNGKEFRQHELITAAPCCADLLRASLCQLGTRPKREHQRPRAAVLSQETRLHQDNERRSPTRGRTT